jgi:hypothetical protein
VHAGQDAPRCYVQATLCYAWWRRHCECILPAPLPSSDALSPSHPPTRVSAQASGPSFDELVLTDMAKSHLAAATHASFFGLHAFAAANGGAWPDPSRPDHIEAVLAHASKLFGEPLSAPEALCVRQLVACARGCLNPMTSVVGVVAGL